jgi:dynein assembly factor 1
MSHLAVQELDGEEEDEGIQMTKKTILDCCRKHQLYVVPNVNDVLYLHSEGFPKIKNLNEYTNLKALWLNNNQITVIENIDHLTSLHSLYLQNNLIAEIAGLDMLVHLETLCLSNNYIRRVRGLSQLVQLKTLEIDHNSVKDADGLAGIVECPSIQILNITYNQIADDRVIDVLERMPDLRVLRIDSNPLVPGFRNYRRVMMMRLRQLTYLDDEPITERDRRLLAAWVDGGKAAEMEERQRMRREKDDAERSDLRDLRKMQREAMLKDGKDIRQYPELMSSDDEDKPRRVVEITEEEAKQNPHEHEDLD